MSWAKLDDGFHMHPKVLPTSLEALGLFALGLSYAACYETDGYLNQAVAHILGRGDTGRLANELVTNGLWDVTPTGYTIRGFLKYNPSKASLLRERKLSKKRVASWRKRNGVTNALVTEGVTRVTPGRVGPGREPPVLLLSEEKRKVRKERRAEVPLPEPFELSDDMRAYAARVELNASYEFGKFKDYHRAHGTRHVDWVAAWRYWVRNSVEREEARNGRRS